MLIDYEYSDWNPMAMDLANFISETVLEIGYPYGTGINWYFDNMMQEKEVEAMIKTYLTRYFEKHMPEEVKQRYQNQLTTFID